MVWISISSDGQKEFLIFKSGTINEEVYGQEVVPLIDSTVEAGRFPWLAISATDTP